MGTFVERGIDVHVILDLMIHDIDIVLSLIPAAPVEVRAVGVSVLTSHIDIANVRLAFENGAVANLTASRVSGTKLRKLRVFQPNTYFSLDYALPELVVCRRTTPVDAARPSVVSEKIALAMQEPLLAEISSFMESVATRSTPVVSGRDGRAALALALQVVDQICHD
jgi:predicted dehydrogenase